MTDPVKPQMKTVDQLKSILMRAGTMFWQPVKALNLAASSVPVKVPFTNPDSIPFLITSIVGYASIPGSSFAKTFEYSVAFKDSARQMIMMQDAIHGSALGSGDFPTKPDVPYLIQGNSTFETEITNLYSAAINVYITFGGFKVSNI